MRYLSREEKRKRRCPACGTDLVERAKKAISGYCHHNKKQASGLDPYEVVEELEIEKEIVEQAIEELKKEGKLETEEEDER